MHHHIPPPPNPLNCRPLQFLGSCRGFLLFNQQPKFDMRNLIVWNPTTGLHKRIPHPNVVSKTNKFLCGFGYDSSTDDYFVIVIEFIVPVDEVAFPPIQVMIKLFSLKSNSWDYNESMDIRCLYSPLERIAGSFLNGALHWMLFSGNNVVILAFDLVKRSLLEIPLPPDESKYKLRDLRVIGGCLALWRSNNQLEGEIWMMKEYGVLSSWSRSIFFCKASLPGEFCPVWLTKDNAILGQYFLGRNFQKLCGETGLWLSEKFSYGKTADFDMYNVQCAVYRESLLSLPNELTNLLLSFSPFNSYNFCMMIGVEQVRSSNESFSIPL